MPVGTTPNLNALWLAAAPGDTISSSPQRVTLSPSKRPIGSAPVTVSGQSFLRDKNVGSTDALLLRSGVRDLVLSQCSVEIDDRAGIKSEGPNGARKVALINCALQGDGNGPQDPLWKNDHKWAQHHYFTGAWTEIATYTSKVYQEHARYFHQIAGNHAFTRCVTKWCGRTAYQFVNRMSESGTPMPIGYGDVTILDDDIEDVCLESGGGGSAYTFRGGMPTSNVRIERSKVRLGCNKLLALPFNKNIAGVLLMDSSGPSKPGAGDQAWPGGTNSLTVIEPDWEVGTEYPGYGNARRSLAKVGNVNAFTLHWGDSGRIVQNGGNGIALEITASVGIFKFSGDPLQWKGQVKYRGGIFQGWTAFAAAHPECRL